MNFSNALIDFEISYSLIDILFSHKQNSIEKTELGGLLFGKQEENNFTVLRISEPNSFDKSTRHSIERNREIDTLLIKHELLNSNGEIQYLGEWHTHPQYIPRISRQDQILLKMNLKLSRLEPPRVFLAIQGIQELGVWTYDGEEVVKMEPLPLPPPSHY